jgi:hypothetical protein
MLRRGFAVAILTAIILVEQIPAQYLEPIAAHVEVTTIKRVYAPGEPIRFRVLIMNKGSSAFWISKAFSRGGGGVAGFDVTITQLSGRKPSKCGDSAGDRFLASEPRTPEQILKEDYFVLRPMEVVGFEGQYSKCDRYYAGKYQITAEYSAQDANQARVKSLRIQEAPVLDGTYRSDPVTFMIR